MDKIDRRLIRRMIIQEAVLLKRKRQEYEQNIAIAEYCARKETKMLSEGYTQLESNEAILRDLNEGFIMDMLGLTGDVILGMPRGFFDSIEQLIIEKILGALFGRFDPDTFAGAVITNTLENIDITEIQKYFGQPGACTQIVDVIFKGLVEALSQQGMDKLFGKRSDAGYLTAAMRESLANTIHSSEFADGIKGKINDVICNLNYNAILDSLKSGFGNFISGFGHGQAPAQAE